MTQDVISIRARRVGKRIAYRVVDEYETEFALAKKTSTEPLSLRQVIRFIDGTGHAGETEGGGLVFSVLEINIEGSGDPESLRGFVVVSSSFYPQLTGYYQATTDRYLDRFALENDEEDEDEVPAGAED